MTTSRFTALFKRRDDSVIAAKASADPKPDVAGETAATSAPDKAVAADETKFGLDALLPPPGGLPPFGGLPPPGAKANAASRMVEREKARPALAGARETAAAWQRQVAAMDGRTLAATAAVFLALGTGWIAGRIGGERHGTAVVLGTALSELRQTRDQVTHLTAELRGVRSVVETLRGEREGTPDAEPLVRQLTERLVRTGQENATRVGRLTEQLDRIEKTGREALRLATVASAEAAKPEKDGKPEKVGAAPSAASGKTLDPVHTGSIALGGETRAEFDPRKVRLEGFVLRDYDDGFALIETRSGRFLEVAVGHSLPGVGRVDAIERRGRQWVVITPKGFIGER